MQPLSAQGHSPVRQPLLQLLKKPLPCFETSRKKTPLLRESALSVKTTGAWPAASRNASSGVSGRMMWVSTSCQKM